MAQPPQPGNRLSFSFVRCVRACERAKLCVGASESTPPPSRLGELKISSGARFVAGFYWGFKEVMECDQQSWGFKDICPIRWTVLGF